MDASFVKVNEDDSHMNRMKTQAVEKPFQCIHCDKTVIQKGKLVL